MLTSGLVNRSKFIFYNNIDGDLIMGETFRENYFNSRLIKNKGKLMTQYNKKWHLKLLKKREGKSIISTESTELLNYSAVLDRQLD